MNIGTFSWDAIGLVAIYKAQDVPTHPQQRYRRKLTDNVSAYAHWVMEVLCSNTTEKPDPTYQQWNACAIYMNEKNVKFLHRCFLPFDWLNLSPCTDDSLKDDQYAVDEKEVIVNVITH